MKILGIGNALVDIIITLPDDNILSRYNLKRGSMQLIDKDLSSQILNSVSELSQVVSSGGSSANTIIGLSRLNVETGFIGKIGKDVMGQYFINDLIKNKVKQHLGFSQTQSGTAIVLVSTDGERTFATELGAAIELTPADISKKIISNYNLIHIEGYLLQNYELIEFVVNIAKSARLYVSMDLSSYNVVEQNIAFLKKLIPGNVDILFANEDEARSLSNLPPEEAILYMGELVPLSIVKLGANGSIIYDRKRTYKIISVHSECKDTTGAGDLYAAGFLYGITKSKSIEICGKYGSILSGYVISVIGAKIQDQQWNEIIPLIS